LPERGVSQVLPVAAFEGVEDGCGVVGLAGHVLSWPSLSILFTFFFIWTWNEFSSP
jgi:hypothetical protein